MGCKAARGLQSGQRMRRSSMTSKRWRRPTGWNFEAVEAAVRRRVLAVAALAVDRPLNAYHADHAGAQRPCAGCRGPARYARCTTSASLGGPDQLPLARARVYYRREAPTLYLEGRPGKPPPVRGTREVELQNLER